MKKFSFEKSVIDPLLTVIRDNQEYLTKKENLPQLAKLGYMYNTLWYSGRLCWGSDGFLSKSKNTYDCEENPKYKIEMCEPKNEKIENLIYDAWGMHVSNDGNEISFDEFKNLIYDGVPLTEVEIMETKPNKTMTDWIELLTHPQYKYRRLFQSKKSVYNHLLCVIGNGFALSKKGFVVRKASGADQDISLYGDWKNAKFAPEIKKIVDSIMSIPEVSQTLEKNREIILEERAKQEKRKSTSELLLNKLEELGGEKLLELFKGKGEGVIEEVKNFIKRYDEILGLEKTTTAAEKYHNYYPICNYSIIYQIVDKSSLKRIGIKTVDPSIIDAGVEICTDILNHESQEEENNVKFAKRFLAVYGGKSEFKSFVPKEIDKKGTLKSIQNIFNGFNPAPTIILNDTEVSEYADDNIHISFDINDIADAPKGIFNNIEGLKGASFYKELKSIIEKIELIPDVQRVNFDYENHSTKIMTLFVVINPKYMNEYNNTDKIQSESDFIADGFMVGGHSMAKKLDKMGLIVVTAKSEPLGSKHPNNKSGKEYFSQAKYFYICDEEWNAIVKLRIDERNYNTLQLEVNDKNNLEIRKWVLDEFNKMKQSNPEYGTYGILGGKEGTKCLYAFGFINWLYNNQIQ